MAKRVLIIDDEPHIREVAQVSLEASAGWSVLTASSGEEAVEIAGCESLDVILLDVMMPGLNGEATVQRLKSKEPSCSVPVILLTAKVGAADRDSLSGLGVAGLIPKPFDPLRLASDVSRVLGWDSQPA